MNLVRIPFYGTAINAVQTDDGVHVVLRPTCEALDVLPRDVVNAG